MTCLTRSLVRVNSSISHLARSGHADAAVQLFSDLHSSHGLTPDQYSLSSAVAASTSATPQLHSYAIKTSLISFRHVHNSLLSYYSKTHFPFVAHKIYNELATRDEYSHTSLLSAYMKGGRVEFALKLFDEMPKHNVSVWNAVLTGCVENQYDGLALEVFVGMTRAGVSADRYGSVAVLSLCSEPEMVNVGKQVHALVVRCGIVVWQSVACALVSMYFRCGLVGDGWGVFQGVTSVCDCVMYNAVIAGMMDNGKEFDGFLVFKRMLSEAGLEPNEITILTIMGSCTVKEFGQQVHGLMLKSGLGCSTLVGNAAVAMYSRCADLTSAELVFDSIDEKDVVSWNSLISGYSQQGCHESAIGMYVRMVEAGTRTDEFTLGSLIAGCRFVVQVEMLHVIAVKNGLVGSTQVCNSLISGFAKFGEITNAYRVFTMTSSKNLISWNSILGGCLLSGLPLKTLEMFSALVRTEIKPNVYTLTTMLSTCASISFLGNGKQIHAYVIRFGYVTDTSLQNALITMYSKCGCPSWSEMVFRKMARRDVFSWNSMIAAYSQHGKGNEAIQCFRKMQLQDPGVKPDHITFIIILSACSHSGFVDEGRDIFSSMFRDYAMEPGIDHFSCLIDLLGRSGYLDEVESVINTMSCRSDAHIWSSLLSACTIYGNVRLGRTVAKFLLEMEPNNPAIYVLLSNVNAAAGRWEEASNVREQLSKSGLVKKAGFSWVESHGNSSS